MSCYALFYNNNTENIEVYPLMETHNYTKAQIENYLENNPDAEKWIIYDHLPTEVDIEDFENLIDTDDD